MLMLLLLVGVCVVGIRAFGAAPIQWMKFPAGRFVVAPRGFQSAGSYPQELVIVDGQGKSGIPSFAAQPDKTIRWDATGLCVEAVGTKRGDAVGINRCNGGPNQKWDWVPTGHGHNMIRLHGHTQCLDVIDKEGSFNGAAIELRDCVNGAAESWNFEEVLFYPTQGKGSISPVAVSSSAQTSLTPFFALAAVGALSLSVWLWRWRAKAPVVATIQSSLPLHVDQDGVALSMLSSVGECGTCLSSNVNTGEREAVPASIIRQQGFINSRRSQPQMSITSANTGVEELLRGSFEARCPVLSWGVLHGKDYLSSNSISSEIDNARKKLAAVDIDRRTPDTKEASNEDDLISNGNDSDEQLELARKKLVLNDLVHKTSGDPESLSPGFSISSDIGNARKKLAADDIGRRQPDTKEVSNEDDLVSNSNESDQHLELAHKQPGDPESLSLPDMMKSMPWVVRVAPRTHSTTLQRNHNATLEHLRDALKLFPDPRGTAAALGVDELTRDGLKVTAGGYAGEPNAGVDWLSSILVNTAAGDCDIECCRVATCWTSALSAWSTPRDDVPNLVTLLCVAPDCATLMIDFLPRKQARYDFAIEQSRDGSYPTPDSREAFEHADLRKDFNDRFFTEEARMWRADLLDQLGVKSERPRFSGSGPLFTHVKLPLCNDTMEKLIEVRTAAVQRWMDWKKSVVNPLDHAGATRIYQQDCQIRAQHAKTMEKIFADSYGIILGQSLASAYSGPVAMVNHSKLFQGNGGGWS